MHALTRQRLGGSKHPARRFAGLACALGGMTDIDRDVSGAGRRRPNAGRDVVGGAPLLLDRGRDRTGDAADTLDGLADRLDRGDRLLGRKLHAGDLVRYLVGCLGSLAGECLDLLGDDREAAARIARARSLDGGIQRQKIGLLGY